MRTPSAINSYYSYNFFIWIQKVIQNNEAKIYSWFDSKLKEIVLICLVFQRIYFIIPKSDNAQCLSYCFHEIIKIIKILSYVTIEYEMDSEDEVNNISIMGIVSKYFYPTMFEDWCNSIIHGCIDKVDTVILYLLYVISNQSNLIKHHWCVLVFTVH